MKPKRIIWLIAVMIFVLPPTIYFVVNGYWWLFGNRILNTSRFGVSSLMSIFGIYFAVASAALGGIFRD